MEVAEAPLASLIRMIRLAEANGVKPSSVENGSNISTEPVWISWVYN